MQKPILNLEIKMRKMLNLIKNINNQYLNVAIITAELSNHQILSHSFRTNFLSRAHQQYLHDTRFCLGFSCGNNR